MISRYIFLKCVAGRTAEGATPFRPTESPTQDTRFQSYYDDFRTRKYHSHNNRTCFAV